VKESDLRRMFNPHDFYLHIFQGSFTKTSLNTPSSGLKFWWMHASSTQGPPLLVTNIPTTLQISSPQHQKKHLIFALPCTNAERTSSQHHITIITDPCKMDSASQPAASIMIILQISKLVTNVSRFSQSSLATDF